MFDHFSTEWSMFMQSYIPSSQEEGCLAQPWGLGRTLWGRCYMNCQALIDKNKLIGGETGTLF